MIRRGSIYAQKNKFADTKILALAKEINRGNLAALANANMSSIINTYKYIEDGTDEIRNVTVITLGCLHK